jgi:membrane protease YdiL (CAAX protease family)
VERDLDGEHLLSSRAIRTVAVAVLTLAVGVGIPLLATQYRFAPLAALALLSTSLFAPRGDVKVILVVAGVAYLAQAIVNVPLAPLLVVAAIVTLPSLRARMLGLPPVRWWFGGIALGVLSSAVVWLVWLAPFLESSFLRPGLVPVEFRDPLPLLVVTVVSSAGVNAVFEEALWRFAVVQSLIFAGAPLKVAVVVSAASFGTAHLNGAPPGVLGIVSTFGFGLAASVLFIRSRSLLPGVLGHFIADVAIIAPLAR